MQCDPMPSYARERNRSPERVLLKTIREKSLLRFLELIGLVTIREENRHELCNLRLTRREIRQ